jgi:hypothetical protein
MEKLILDTVRGIEFDKSNPPLNNLHALGYLPKGIFTLANQIRKYEVGMEDGTDFPISGVTLAYGPSISNIEMVACCFSWYSISLHNYLKLVGLVELVMQQRWSREDVANPENGKKIKLHCTNYVKDVIPEIHRWRNKIAAHFAITAPFPEDNQALLEFSAMNNIAYMSPYFYAGALQWGTKGGKTDLPKWSVTESIQTLTPRLWPQAM